MFRLYAYIQSVQGEDPPPPLSIISEHVLKMDPGCSGNDWYVARPILCNVIFQYRMHTIL